MALRWFSCSLFSILLSLCSIGSIASERSFCRKIFNTKISKIKVVNPIVSATFKADQAGVDPYSLIIKSLFETEELVKTEFPSFRNIESTPYVLLNKTTKKLLDKIVNHKASYRDAELAFEGFFESTSTSFVAFVKSLNPKKWKDLSKESIYSLSYYELKKRQFFRILDKEKFELKGNRLTQRIYQFFLKTKLQIFISGFLNLLSIPTTYLFNYLPYFSQIRLLESSYFRDLKDLGFEKSYENLLSKNGSKVWILPQYDRLRKPLMVFSLAIYLVAYGPGYVEASFKKHFYKPSVEQSQIASKKIVGIISETTGKVFDYDPLSVDALLFMWILNHKDGEPSLEEFEQAKKDIIRQAELEADLN